mgnify:FL=1
MSTKLKAWESNNPEGFQRAIDQSQQNFFDVWDFKDQNWEADALEREIVASALPRDPDAIEQAKYELLQTLSPEEYAKRDAVVTVRNNLGLAQSMAENNIDESEYKLGLIRNSQKALEGQDITMQEIAEKYGMNSSNPLLKNDENAAEAARPVEVLGKPASEAITFTASKAS